MAFGRAFTTRKEANKFRDELLKKNRSKLEWEDMNGLHTRKMPKKVFPRRKKLYHVGTYLDYVNFA